MLIDDKQIAKTEDSMHGIDNFVEATGSSTFLGEPNNTESTSFAVFDDSHDFGGE
jgi:hypothetical protein